MNEDQLFQSLKESEDIKIEIPKIPNLDVLCTTYLIKSFINPEVSIVTSQDNSFKIVKGDETISISELAANRNLTTSKFVYSYMVRNNDKLVKPFTHNILKLVDYCSRAVMKNLNRQERKPGSFVYVIYGIRNFVSLEELYSVFSHLSDKIMQESNFLTAMCDIELYLYNQELAEKINQSTVETKELIAKKVRFAKVGDNYSIAFNYSDINLAKTLFLHNKDMIAYIYFNNETGIIFKRNFQSEIALKIKERLSEMLDLEVRNSKHFLIKNRPDNLKEVEDAIVDAIYKILEEYDL